MPPSAIVLSLVIPAWNEAAGIQRAIIEATEAFDELGWDHEILVVDDGSTDGTAEQVEEIASLRSHIRVVRHSRNLGYGAALRTGFQAARGEFVGFTDADSQFYPQDFERLLPHAHQFPVVVGRRIDRQDPPLRRFYSWGYNRLVRWLLDTGVRDCDCAMKIFRREALLHLLPESPNYFANAEMLCRARRLGMPIAEVGVRHRARAVGESKVSLRAIPQTLARLLPFWMNEVVRARRPEPVVLVRDVEPPLAITRKTRKVTRILPLHPK